MIVNPQRWTYTAKKCYNIGCVCYKCDAVPDDIKAKCRMKYSVIQLVRNIGRPKEQ